MKAFFYGHSAGLGAGHFVRSLRLAEEARSCGWETFALWPGPELECLNRSKIELLRLPELVGRKVDLSILSKRTEVLRNFIRDWVPDVVVVDLMPFGYGGELVDVLLEEGRSRFVWGLPYAERESNRLKNPRLKKAFSRYAEVLVYGEKEPDDPLEAYADFELPRASHVGVVTEILSRWVPESPKTVACLVGSGGLAGGDSLRRRLRDALPEEVRIRFVAGPLGDIGERRELPGVEDIQESSLADALRGVTAVVSRAGYNTSYALMTASVPVVFVPSSWPEQFARARALSSLPGVHCLDESELSKLWPLLQSGPEVVERDLPFRLSGSSAAIEVLERVVRKGVPR
ncbi:MAG: hypothetical protein KC800_14595 [Candidatus Eremiobacteraeota bacterium]|nr:hypothetical protein [Candidatus Eremiobacteraeota bacterium]